LRTWPSLEPKAHDVTVRRRSSRFVGDACASRHRAPQGVGSIVVQCEKIVQSQRRRENGPHASHAILAGKIINLIVISREGDALV
jgi:hypothetical protein